MKTLLLRKIGFSGTTGDDRSPESFPFPAAMTSIMEYLKEDLPVETIHAHGRSYTRRRGNLDFVAASGIGFALLWDRNLCFSAMDLLQAAPYDRGIANAFAWAGWEYEQVKGEIMRSKAVAAIDKGIPLIALGLTDVPEAALICGYDQDGETLIGWSHFQEGMQTIENGMFQKSGWQDSTWMLIIPTRRVGRSFTLPNLLAVGVEIMSQSQIEGYLAGDAAYAAWCTAIEDAVEENEAFYQYHHNILFNLAEARAWCGDFLKGSGVKAGRHFHHIHDLCWEADAAAPNAAAMAQSENRKKLLAVMDQIRKEDQAALEELKREAMA